MVGPSVGACGLFLYIDVHHKGPGGCEIEFFFGVSYGSQLGSQYAELFPEHVGRMVLDGVLDHSQNQVTSLMDEVISLESTVSQFFKWCNTTSDCAFYHHDLPAIFDNLVDEANANPIPAPGCLTPAEAAAKGTTACRSDVTGYELISNTQS